IGHGAIAPNHFDVTYSVYDRPVSDEDGIRASDIIGILTVDQYQEKKYQLPHFVLVFDTCYSGNMIPIDHADVIDRDGSQVTANVKSGFPIPDTVVVLTSSSGGADTRVFPMNGTNLAAYSALFAATLDSEWDCANLEHDGLLTVAEVHKYIGRELAKAFSPLGLIDGPMKV